MQRGAVRASHALRPTAVRPSARPLSSSPSLPAPTSRSTSSRGATASRALNGGAVRSVMRLYAPLTPDRSARRYATEQPQEATKAPETPQPPPAANAAASPKMPGTGKPAAPGGKGKGRKLDIGEMLKGVEAVKLEPYMERVKSVPPDEAAGLVLMNGWTNYNHGHTAEAIKFFEAARRLNLEADTPDSRKDALGCWDALVVAHATKGRLGVAIDELLGKLEHQLKGKEIDVESFFKDVQDLIKLYNEMELHEEALALLDTVVEHVLPKVGDREAGLWTYGELANQLRQLESYDEALEVAHGVLESEATIYPKEPHKSFNTHIFIATVHQDRGDRQATVEALSKALDCLRSMSKGETFWKYTAFIYENLADHSEELGLLDKAIKYKELQLSALSEVVEFVLTTGASPWLVAEQDLRRLRDLQAGKKPDAADKL